MHGISDAGSRRLPPVGLALALAAAALVAGCDGAGNARIPGLIEWERIELIAETSEPIVEIVAAEGTRLGAGDPVVRLDERRVRAQRDEAQAAVIGARARLAELRRGPRSERIDEARARLRGAQGEAEAADNELTRVRSLVAKNLSSEEALDNARARRDRALADRDAAQAALEELIAGTTVEELRQAEAALAQAEARLESIALTLERMTLHAPRPAIVDSVLFEQGEQPAAGDVVAVLLAGERPYVRAYVPEPQRAGVTVGSRAVVSVDGIAGPFEAKVRMASRDPVFTPYFSLTEYDRSRLSYVVEVVLEGDRARELPAGVPVTVEFPDGPATAR